MNDTVLALTVYNGELVAGGYFTTAGSVIANFIAGWNGTSWQPLGSGVNGQVSALTVYNGELIAGGEFTTAGDHPSAFFARWGPNCPRGDMNCDQIVDLDDVPLFVDAVLNPETLGVCISYTANTHVDVHPDGAPRIDGLDVQSIVVLLAP